MSGLSQDTMRIDHRTIELRLFHAYHQMAS